MRKFGSGRVENNNPSFGNNPAVPSQKCYHLFMVKIFWPLWGPPHGDLGIIRNGVGKLRDKLPWYVKPLIPRFSGTIVKLCKCMSQDEALRLLNTLSEHDIPSPIKFGGGEGHSYAEGVELTARTCGCLGSTMYSDCKGKSGIELVNQQGKQLKVADGFWTTSNGDTRQFPSNNKQDIMRDIVNTERGLSLPCCDKKSSSSSTSLLN